ncbi:hypothetical protein PS15p_200062 [Mucor circinelloides]
MPAFCRHCQKPDHCHADCPDYHKWAICYHCSKREHVSKNCDWNNAESIPAKVRVVEKPYAKPKERKGAKSTPPPTKKGDPARRGSTSADKDITMMEATQPKPSSNILESSSQPAHNSEDTIMEAESTTAGMSDADALKTVSWDVSPSRSHIDPTTAAKKLICQDSSADISDARYQGSASPNSHDEAVPNPGNDTEKTDRNLNPPAQAGTPPSNNL